MTIFLKYYKTFPIFLFKNKTILNIQTLLSEYFDYFYFCFLEVFSSETFWIIRSVELEHKCDIKSLTPAASEHLLDFSLSSTWILKQADPCLKHQLNFSFKYFQSQFERQTFPFMTCRPGEAAESAELLGSAASHSSRSWRSSSHHTK